MQEVLAGNSNFERGSSPLQSQASNDQDFPEQFIFSKTASKSVKGQAISTNADGLKVELLKVIYLMLFKFFSKLLNQSLY